MRRVGLALAAAGVLLAAGPVLAASAPAAPYHDPSFHCRFYHYAEDQKPPLNVKTRHPFCVDYAKRDITVDNGGAVRFTAAEPARFAAAGHACRYWQTDHWRVQLDRGDGHVVQWDGSYWYDEAAGVGGAILRHFRVAGQPMGAAQAAAAVSTVSPALAATFRRYGAGRDGGGGSSFTLPVQPGCAPGAR